MDYVIALTGEFDLSNARSISDIVTAALRETTVPRMVLDLKDVTFLDCAAIRSILYAQALCTSAGCALIIRNPMGIVAEAIDILGLAARLYGQEVTRRHEWLNASNDA